MAIERIETTILRNLLHNEEYYRKVVPFLKAEYYENYHEKVIFEEIADFAAKYDKVPTKEVLTINLQNRNDLTDDTYQDSVQAVQGLTDEWVDYEWLLDATEKSVSYTHLRAHETSLHLVCRLLLVLCNCVQCVRQKILLVLLVKCLVSHPLIFSYRLHLRF